MLLSSAEHTKEEQEEEEDEGEKTQENLVHLRLHSSRR